MNNKLKEISKCKCGGEFAWEFKSGKGSFSNSVVKCGKCGKELSAAEAHEFTQEVLKQVK